jgi:hypothetical protein
MEFTCECCHYSTTVKSNYTKHLASNKHNIRKDKQTATDNQQIVIPETTKTNNEPVHLGCFCKYCNKEYKHKSSLSKHNKYSCNKNKEDKLEDLTEVQLMIRKMEADIIGFQLEKQELLNERKELQKIFDKRFELQMKQIEYLTCVLELRALL